MSALEWLQRVAVGIPLLLLALGWPALVFVALPAWLGGVSRDD